MKTGVDLIADERKHQIEKLGFNAAYDDTHRADGKLLQLAQYCILSNDDNMPKGGWTMDYIKQFHLYPRIQQLTIAGALIAAEIDRRMRIEKENEIAEDVNLDQ